MTEHLPKCLPSDRSRLKRIAARHGRALTPFMLAGYRAAVQHSREDDEAA